MFMSFIPIYLDSLASVTIFPQVIGFFFSEVLDSAERPTGKHHWMPVNWHVTQDGGGGDQLRYLWSQ